MLNRIDQKFKELRKQNKKAFLAFLTAGYPNLQMTESLVASFEKIGVDIVELGVPFSDPLADGPTIQSSSYAALQGQVNLEKIFRTVARIRENCSIPLALMTYYNPLLNYGEKRFVERARLVGADGVIVPDLPPEEAGNLIGFARDQNFATIFFLSPTTTPERMKRIIHNSTGFIYYVSVTGVTGTRKKIPQEFLANVSLAKKLTAKPICVGFGISTPKQIREIAQKVDGVIVGSAIIKSIEKNLGKPNLVKNVSGFVKTLVKTIN